MPRPGAISKSARAVNASKPLPAMVKKLLVGLSVSGFALGGQSVLQFIGCRVSGFRVKE